MTEWIRKLIHKVLIAFTVYGTTLIMLDYTNVPADWRIGLLIVTITLVIAAILDEIWPEKE